MSIPKKDLAATGFSPKATLSYEPDKNWQVTGSFGRAVRFPTVTELYQTVTVPGAVHAWTT